MATQRSATIDSYFGNGSTDAAAATLLDVSGSDTDARTPEASASPKVDPAPVSDRGSEYLPDAQEPHEPQTFELFESELLAQRPELETLAQRPELETDDDAAAVLDEETEQTATDVLGKALATAKPVCSKCFNEVDPFRAQIRSKMASAAVAKWVRNTCNSRLASLSRSFGGWPVKEHTELSEEAQLEFWKDIATPGVTIANMKSKLLERVVKQRTEKVKAMIAGSWLPLSVYAAKGYDTTMIEKNCVGDNIRDHPMLGKTYRVPISSLSRSAAEETIRRSVLESWSDATRRVQEKLSQRPVPTLEEPVEQTSPAEEALKVQIA